MNLPSKWRLPVLAALALCAPCVSFAAAVPDASASLFPDPVVASGKGFEIKRSVVDDFFLKYRTGLIAQGQDVPDAARPIVESNILQHLIVNKILVQKATDAEKDKAREAVRKEIEAFRTNAGSEEVFQAQLKAAGSSIQDMTDRGFEKEVSAEVLLRELVPSNAVSDDSIKKFYDENPDRFVIPERAHVAQILISALDPVTGQPLPDAVRVAKKKLAADVRAKAAAASDDFAKLVKQYSDDAATKDKGGEVSFARNSTGIPDFEVAAFSLKTNQVSDVVESRFGFHIIKLLDTIPQSKAPLGDATAQIRNYLTGKEIDDRMPEYLAKLEAEYEVKASDFAGGTATPPKPVTPAAAPGATNK